MSSNSKMFPVVITVMFIIIIIYLFATVEQPLVVCEKTFISDIGVEVVEVVETTLDGRKIKNMVVYKNINLPDKYLNNGESESVIFLLDKAYDYLDDDSILISKSRNKITLKIDVSNDETIILGNIDFFDNGGLQLKVNSNTKSSDVLTLKVGDNYTEGEFMTRLKNNGYSCK